MRCSTWLEKSKPRNFSFLNAVENMINNHKSTIKVFERHTSTANDTWTKMRNSPRLLWTCTTTPQFYILPQQNLNTVVIKNWRLKRTSRSHNPPSAPTTAANQQPRNPSWPEAEVHSLPAARLPITLLSFPLFHPNLTTRIPLLFLSF